MAVHGSSGPVYFVGAGAGAAQGGSRITISTRPIDDGLRGRLQDLTSRHAGLTEQLRQLNEERTTGGRGVDTELLARMEELTLQIVEVGQEMRQVTERMHLRPTLTVAGHAGPPKTLEKGTTVQVDDPRIGALTINKKSFEKALQNSDLPAAVQREFRRAVLGRG